MGLLTQRNGGDCNGKCDRAGSPVMTIGKSAQFSEVGRLGLEPRTYGLKVRSSNH